MSCLLQAVHYGSDTDDENDENLFLHSISW